ncbi:MAG: hypothetical protein HYX69_07625 [Planctomycetia bacterium]|nr:hypothetical protein [Planctomycetia bacterium]
MVDESRADAGGHSRRTGPTLGLEAIGLDPSEQTVLSIWISALSRPIRSKRAIHFLNSLRRRQYHGFGSEDSSMGKKQLRRPAGDATPVTGGIAIPDHLVSTPPDADRAPDDDLRRQAYWLLKLHPDAVAKFQTSDLSAMDDDAKRMLIADIRRALGIAPLKSDVL